MQSKPLIEPKFVGREQELRELEQYLKQVIEGKGTTVFISGEAGVGKTRLISAFLKKAKIRGVTILSGWCLSEAGAPYFPFIEAFNTYFASLDEKEQPSSVQKQEVKSDPNRIPQIEVEKLKITTWLTKPRLVEKPGRYELLSSQVWKDQVYATVAKTLHSISVRKPVILFIDDIHWADSASLAMLHYLARSVYNSERILILATFRSEELTVDSEGHSHILTETLRLMRREELFNEIQLSNLNEANVLKLAETMIGGNLQNDFAEKLAKESQGNALFVVESLRMLVGRKGLIQEKNQWQLVTDKFNIPSKIKDIILRRLSVLNYGQRRVLDAASVIGEKFNLDLLSSVLGLDSLEVLETLNTIANRTSIVCAEKNIYRFDHAKSREILYEELSVPLKMGYHARIAKILENTKSKELSISDLAYHYAKAGKKEKSIKFSLEAGKDALEKYSSSQAISHFTYVLQVLEEDPQYAEQKNIALEGLGDAYYADNKFKLAVKTYETLAKTEVNAFKLRALLKAMFASFLQGDIQHLAELVNETEEIGDISRIDRARILHFKALMVTDIDDQANFWEEALMILEEEYALSEAARLSYLNAVILSIKGEMQKALAKCLRAIAIYEDLSEFRSLMGAYTVTGGGIFSGYAFFGEALGMLEKVFEIENKTKMGNFRMLEESCMYSAIIFGFKGDFAGAVKKDLKALEYLAKADSHLHLIHIYSDLVMNYVKLKDMVHAEEYFNKLNEMQLPANVPYFAFYLDLAKAMYYAGKNQWKQSMKHFAELEANSTTQSMYTINTISFRANLAWALEKQGKIEEGKKIWEPMQKVFEENNKQVKHATVELSLIAPINVTAGQIFEARLDIVNVSRANCTIINIQNLLPPELMAIAIPINCTTHEDVFKLKDKILGPFSVKTVTIDLQASKVGTFNLNPQVEYVDDLGKTRTSTTKAIAITAKPEKPKYKVLPGRIPTGSTELDSLLLGGIPENYAVVLSCSPSDEREMIVKNFLEAGIHEEDVTFFVSTEAVGLENLIEDPNFYLFLCNPKPKTKVHDLPNVYKLRSKTDLTNLSISLAKAFRNIDPSKKKRICVETVSDVLLEYGAKATRKWISELIPDLTSKGFTIIVVINPLMHSSEDLHAILDLFDGEIELAQTGDPLECKKSIRVKKLRNQDFNKNPICLTKIT